VFYLKQLIHGSSFLFPAWLDFWSRGSGRGEEPGGEEVLRLIQIRLATRILKKSGQLVKPIRRKPAPPIKFQKRRQLFIRAHNETLSVVAMRVNDPDRSPFGINRFHRAILND
jgi:hypothetical protein